MEHVVLQAKQRNAGRHAVRELRLASLVPAVVYGPDVETQSVAVDAKSLQKALAAAGAGLLTLEIEGAKPVQVLARDVQRHPVKHRALHVDFMAVSMTEKMRLEVPVVLEGEAPALANADLVIVRNLDTVEVECLPTDIPNHIVGDLSRLKTAEDVIHAKDLALPEGVRLVSDPEHVIASLTITRAAVEEEAEVAEEQAPGEVEVVGKGKAKEEEEEAE